MKTQIRRRPIGATVLAIVLGWLGVGGLLNAVGWPLLRSSALFKSAPRDVVENFPPVLGSLQLSLFALAYGVSALVAARAVWRMSASAANLYGVWVAIVLASGVWLVVRVPGASSSSMPALLLAAAVMLAAGWLFIRRLVQQ
jgi:hypothetical protein